MGHYGERTQGVLASLEIELGRISKHGYRCWHSFQQSCPIQWRQTGDEHCVWVTRRVALDELDRIVIDVHSAHNC